MTDRITIRYQENLPMPLIYLASAEDLAAWYVSQLEWAYAQGYRELTISCFDTAPMGYEVASAAYTVLRAVMGFMKTHPEVEHLTILCGDANALRAYELHRNMWYAHCAAGSDWK